jgi:arylsulfatase A-like enzyme
VGGSPSAPSLRRALLLAAVTWLALPGCAPSPPPNLVVVTLDTTRADHLGLYGYFRDTSPRLDALGRESIVFERAFAPMAITLPSHLSLFTASHPLEHGVLANQRRHGRRWSASPGLVSFAQAARRAGHRTAAFVSAAPLRAGSGIEAGFEVYDEPPADLSARSGQLTTDAALAWLAQIGDAPFLLWVHYYDAHWPLAPDAALDAHFQTDAALEAWLDARRVAERSFHEGVLVDDPRGTMNLYDAELRFQDAQLGRLLDALAARPDWERTSVLVVGDHGEGLSQHGQPAHGGSWNEQLHVPLVVRVPGERARRVERLASVEDALPTLLGLAHFPGAEDFLAQASGRDALAGEPRAAVLGLDGGDKRRRPDYRRALVTERWKYFRTDFGAGARRHELYDLEADPFELEDVASRHPDVVARFDRELDAELAQRRARGRELGEAADAGRVDPELARQLHQLGYVDEEPEPARRRAAPRLRRRPAAGADGS